MGRREGSVEVPEAGVILTGKVKSLAPDLPVLVYCGNYKSQALGPNAHSAGVQLVTVSTELLGEVKSVLSQAGRVTRARQAGGGPRCARLKRGRATVGFTM